MLSSSDKNISFAIQITSEYVSDMAHIESCFVKFKSFRDVFLWGYYHFLSDGLVPIEELDDDTKRDIFNTTLEWEAAVLPNEARVALCRCVWTLNYIMEKYLRV